MKRKARGPRAHVAAGLLAFFALAVAPGNARADDDAASPYFTFGIPLTLASLISDTIQWGIIGTTSPSAHWAWHAVPGAGPVVGFLAYGNDHCGPGHDEPQCGGPREFIQVTQVVYFGCEMAGLALIGAGLYKRTQPRFPAAVSEPPMLVPRLAVTRDGFSIGVGAAF